MYDIICFAYITLYDIFYYILWYVNIVLCCFNNILYVRVYTTLCCVRMLTVCVCCNMWLTTWRVYYWILFIVMLLYMWLVNIMVLVCALCYRRINALIWKDNRVWMSVHGCWDIINMWCVVTLVILNSLLATHLLRSWCWLIHVSHYITFRVLDWMHYI